MLVDVHTTLFSFWIPKKLDGKGARKIHSLLKETAAKAHHGAVHEPEMLRLVAVGDLNQKNTIPKNERLEPEKRHPFRTKPKTSTQTTLGGVNQMFFVSRDSKKTLLELVR